MKKEKHKSIIEWTFAVLLIVFVVSKSSFFQYYHLSPSAAYEQSERSYHYGPSEIIEEVELGDVRIYLGKYKEWFSANMIERRFGFLWTPGSGVGGIPIDTSEELNYSWQATQTNDQYVWNFFGIVHNQDITQIEIDVVDDYQYEKMYAQEQIETYTYQVNSERMFLINWSGENRHAVNLRGINDNNEVLYEKDLN
ncbi:hypothetical protein [Gracilibacillus massiliensis]|uniref:hypothetical protein n=1 Tax=Gracilibacillus massiliensis TaxID=1564956 RepID=UPI00071DB6C3|nr:hypothetical protein [Gracilibacillus massiliensis]